MNRLGPEDDESEEQRWLTCYTLPFHPAGYEIMKTVEELRRFSPGDSWRVTVTSTEKQNNATPLESVRNQTSLERSKRSIKHDLWSALQTRQWEESSRCFVGWCAWASLDSTHFLLCDGSAGISTCENRRSLRERVCFASRPRRHVTTQEEFHPSDAEHHHECQLQATRTDRHIQLSSIALSFNQIKTFTSRILHPFIKLDKLDKDVVRSKQSWRENCERALQ